MSSTSRQARRELLDQLKQVPKDKLPEKVPDLEQEIIGPDHQIQPENARAIANQVGNNALARMLKDAGRQEGPAIEIEEVQEEEQEQEEETEQEEAWDEQLESAFTAHMGGVASAGMAMDAEEWQHDYGGDDDTPPPPPPRRVRQFRRGWNPANNQVRDRAGLPDEDAELPELEDLPELGHPDEPSQDERFDALWGWVQNTATLTDPDLQPERLIQPPDPLARCLQLGDFFARSARDPVARALGRLCGPLPGPNALSAQVARAAALGTRAGLVEAKDGPVEVVTQAAVIALEREARAQCRVAAHQCVQRARLAAHLVFDEASQGEASPGPGPVQGAGRRAQGLMEAAIVHAVRPWPLRPPQGYAQRVGGDDTHNESTAELDALLAELTGAAPLPTEVSSEDLQPLIDTTETLVGSAGRAQVEIATAALVVWRATGEDVRTRARALLRAADRELREIARGAVFTGRECEERIEQSLDEAEPVLRRAEATLERLHRQLGVLRESCFGALGQLALGRSAGR